MSDVETTSNSVWERLAKVDPCSYTAMMSAGLLSSDEASSAFTKLFSAWATGGWYPYNDKQVLLNGIKELTELLMSPDQEALTLRRVHAETFNACLAELVPRVVCVAPYSG
jgi:hypothetical protein